MSCFCVFLLDVLQVSSAIVEDLQRLSLTFFCRFQGTCRFLDVEKLDVAVSPGISFAGSFRRAVCTISCELGVAAGTWLP